MACIFIFMPRVKSSSSSSAGGKKKRKASTEYMGALRRFRPTYFGAPLVLANRTRVRLTGKYEYPFRLNLQDANLTFISGTGAGCGMNLYPTAGVPAVPATAGAAASVNMFSICFTLAGAVVQFFTTAGVAAGASIAIPMTNATEYAALFDEYRLDNVRVRMAFNNNNSSMNVPHASAPILLAVKDYDDNAFQTQASMEQYDSFRAIQFGNSSGPNNGFQSISVKPLVQISALTTSGAAVSMSTDGWLDTNNGTQEHFGLKFWFCNTEATATALYLGTVQLFVDYEVRFRGTK